MTSAASVWVSLEVVRQLSKSSLPYQKTWAISPASSATHSTAFPSGDRPLTKEERAEINTNYDEIWNGPNGVKKLDGRCGFEREHGAHDERVRRGTTTRRDLAKDSLFQKMDSWIFGANIPGKGRVVVFYWGGLKNYRQRVDDIVKKRYTGLRFSEMKA